MKAKGKDSEEIDWSLESSLQTLVKSCLVSPSVRTVKNQMVNTMRYILIKELKC